MKNRKIDHTKEALFKELYQEFHASLYAYFFSRTSEKGLAEDLLQELFMNVWKQIEVVQLIRPEQRGFWIFKIAKNRSVDHYRKVRRQGIMTHQVKQQHALEKQKEADISKLVINQETLREVEAELWLLEENLRTILLMQVMGGMNSQQIGDALNIPAGTVRYRLHLARQKLIEALAEPHLEGGSKK